MHSQEFIAIPVDATYRHFTPVYGETRERIIRLGVMNDADVINLEGIWSLCVPFSVTLYDNLLECGDDVLGIVDTLSELCDSEEVTGMYLYLCLLYAQLGDVVPEPIQWISGEREVLFVFFETLIEQLTSYLHEDGFLCDDEDGSPRTAIPITSAIPGADNEQI